MGVALRRLGFTVGAAFDAWETAVHVYNHNAPADVASIANLLSQKGKAQIASGCRRLGGVDLLAAGPPCQGFSQLRNGRHDNRSPQNRVLAAIPDIVSEVRPRVVLIENVPALERHRGGATIRSFVRRLAQPRGRGVRYRVSRGVFDAAHFGTPQARRRLLILAVRMECGEGDRRLADGIALPSPGPDLRPLMAAIRHGGRVPKELSPFLDALTDPWDASMTTAMQALDDLPDLGAGGCADGRGYRSAPTSAYQRLMRKGAAATLSSTRTPGSLPSTRARLRHVPPGGCARYIPKAHLNGLARRYDSAYRRLHPRAPSTALSTRYDCIYHYKHERSLSVREYARLQGLPDAIEFPESLVCRREAYAMIGNAVPPLLIEGVLGAALAAGDCQSRSRHGR